MGRSVNKHSHSLSFQRVNKVKDHDTSKESSVNETEAEELTSLCVDRKAESNTVSSKVCPAQIVRDGSARRPLPLLSMLNILGS